MATHVQVEFKPPMACIGQLTSVGDAKVGKSGNYINIECEVTPEGNGRAQKLWFNFRPEYFSATFKPSTIRDDRSQNFVYGANVGFAVKKGEVVCEHPQKDTFYIGRYLVPVLPGLYGENVAAADEITNQIATLDGDSAVEALNADLKDRVGTTVGYFLRQKYEESKDEINPNTGKPVRNPTPYYEFAGFFTPTEKVMRKIQNDAQKANEKRRKDGKPGEAFVVTFDTDVPFGNGRAANS